jgi:hypothetical protein
VILGCDSSYRTSKRGLDFVVYETTHLGAGPEIVLWNPEVVVEVCTATADIDDIFDLVVGVACGYTARPSSVYSF